MDSSKLKRREMIRGNITCFSTEINDFNDKFLLDSVEYFCNRLKTALNEMKLVDDEIHNLLSDEEYETDVVQCEAYIDTAELAIFKACKLIQRKPYRCQRTNTPTTLNYASTAFDNLPMHVEPPKTNPVTQSYAVDLIKKETMNNQRKESRSKSKDREEVRFRDSREKSQAMAKPKDETEKPLKENFPKKKPEDARISVSEEVNEKNLENMGSGGTAERAEMIRMEPEHFTSLNGNAHKKDYLSEIEGIHPTDLPLALEEITCTPKHPYPYMDKRVQSETAKKTSCYYTYEDSSEEKGKRLATPVTMTSTTKKPSLSRSFWSNQKAQPDARRKESAQKFMTAYNRPTDKPAEDMPKVKLKVRVKPKFGLANKRNKETSCMEKEFTMPTTTGGFIAPRAAWWGGLWERLIGA